VNVLAPLLLTRLLMDRLEASSSARVVCLAGGRPDRARIDLDNLQAERVFKGLETYADSKLAMMAVMYECATRVEGTNVSINVCYPGQASTRMTQSVTPRMVPGALRFAWPLAKLVFLRPDGGRSAAKASRSSVHLASSPDVEGVNATYFNPACEAVPWPAAVLDEGTRRRLWDAVEQLVM